MREYGRVHSAFWTSTDVQALTDDGKLLALYLLTGPHSTIAGVFRLPDGYATEDLRWRPERVGEGFAELFRKGFANRCGTSKWVWIRRFLVWNRPENPNQWKAAGKYVDQIPASCSWRAEFLQVFAVLRDGGSFPTDDGCGTLSEGFRNQDQDQDQDQDQEQKQDQEGGASADAASHATTRERGGQGEGDAPTLSLTAPGTLGAGPATGRGKPKGRKPERSWPDDLVLTPELAQLLEDVLPDVDAARYLDSLRDKARAKDWRYRDWIAAIRNFAKQAAPGSGHWSEGQYPRKVARLAPLARKSVEELEAEERRLREQGVDIWATQKGGAA